MTTGRVAYMPSPGTVELREYEVPEPGPGAVLLKTLLAGVCGSEIHMFGGKHSVLSSVALGHEIVGEVAALGAGVDTDRSGEPLAVGDRVSVTYFRTCMACPACGRQELASCERAYDGWLRSPDEFPHFIGTMSTHYYVDPRQWIYKIPANVPTIAAASANCALSQMVAAIERSAVRPGESIVIQGVGGLGLYGCALAHERGAHVVALDRVPARLARAQEFGAHAVIDMNDFATAEERAERVRELVGRQGADVVMGVAGVPDTFVEGIALARPAGRYVEVGNVLPGVNVTFDIGTLTRRGVTVIPVLRYEPRHLREALAFLSRNIDRYPLASMLDGTYSLDQVKQAIEDSRDRKVTRAAIAPGEQAAALRSDQRRAGDDS